MKVHYLVNVLEPATHIVKVKLSASITPKTQNLTFFLPSWSPGSYLMREYARNIRSITATNDQGEFLQFDQTAKGTWIVDIENSDIKSRGENIHLTYEIYCHELTVRTSHVDESHAFLHGPSYLLGVLNEEFSPTIEFRFSALWSKLHTALEDISEKREVFLYKAATYDDLLDTPVEIGCHESDGFVHDGKEHHLVWYGEQYPHDNNLKKDIKTIVETVSSHFSSIPYEKYMFITHFKRGLYGGLEHKNSTALHYDGRMLGDRTSYINWLALVAHEYFHTWNVKRIRPKELGPFDYLNENYTTMHWLTEGLTSFMDEIFVLRSGLCSLEEYLSMQAKNLQRYFDIPGKKFHSLEQSSFNAWIKLYRPDENTNNSSVSYYLKGGLVFSTLHFELKKVGKSINDLLAKLWDRYLENPAVGVTTEEVMSMIELIGGKDIRQKFELRVSTTEDIDFESYYKENGMEFIWSESNTADFGIDFSFEGERVFAKSVKLDQAAYKSGINAGDEILAINGVRFLKSDTSDIPRQYQVDKAYNVQINRLGRLMNLELIVGKSPRKLQEIKVVDKEKALNLFS